MENQNIKKRPYQAPRMREREEIRLVLVCTSTTENIGGGDNPDIPWS